jgi:uncharacterized FAD-dependent dehydrogenase
LLKPGAGGGGEVGKVALQDEIEATRVVAAIGREGANSLQISVERLAISD